MSEGASRDVRLSRRRFIQRSTLAAGMLALPRAGARAQAALKPVTMTLDWVFQGPNVGFVVAREKGFYREAGLDVSISPGKGSGSTAQLVASKATQFGFSDGFVVGNSVSKGLAIKSVASVYRRNPCAVVVLAESDIQGPKDLEGKSIAITAGSAQFQQWPAFAKGAGIDAGKIRVVNLDPAGVPPALITKQVPAIAGFAQGYVPAIEIRGNKQVRTYWYADYGVTAVSNGIVVHQDLLKSEPELVRAFVTPSIKGFLYARQHPEETIELVRRYSQTIDSAITRREMEYSWKTWVTPNTREKPLGWASDTDWADTVNVLKQYGGVTTPLDAAQLYTNEFVPMGAEFVPPQQA
ncbi:MAG: ABC transporter substrate-binding protein [Hyphomicrobiales bacterium]|nr:ABC transporter substrate-binding protein [Hyphomicrobiales bacterium]